MPNALELVNLTKHYPGFTLDHLSFSLPSGCIMGFIGENGAGKSTTLKLILDLVKRDEGTIRVLGQDADSNLKDIKEHLGVVMDESGFPDHLTALDIGQICRRSYRTWNSQAFSNYLKKFELPTKKMVKALSRGMKMKLSIAVALSHDSRLLILDEATSGLDPIVRDEILDEFLDFIQDEGHSVLISSHIISDLEKICDYITFIHKGRLVFSQGKDELLETYGLVKCGQDELHALPPQAVVGVRRNSFGAEALARREAIPRGYALDNPTLEEIMLYFVKEERP